MSDITHCAGGSCPVRNGCLRFRAVAHGRFDAFGTIPWDDIKRTCEHYVDVTEREPSDDDVRYRAYMAWRAAGSPDGTAADDWHTARRALVAEGASGLRPPDE